jgi:diacylglycerol O-acyltransferase / wax synthase
VSTTRDREKGWAELERWGSERELGELDALMWRTERHPANSWTGVVVLLLDSSPDWERLRAAHEWFVGIVPRFRERVVDPALPVGPSEWAPDPAFDLAYHLRRVRLAAPGTRRQLLDLAQAIGLTPMDRSRPPWIGTLVEGLDDGRGAYLMQAHHVLMDGMALTQLFARVLSPQRETTPDKPQGNRVDSGSVGPIEVAGHELVRQAGATPRLLRRTLKTARKAVVNPLGAARYAASLGHVLAPPPPNKSKVLRGGRRRLWRFGMFECPLADLKAAGKAAGGTVNDTFVCVLLGGLRRYCAEYGEDLPDIPISMPVAMRKLDEAMGGNKFAGAFFAVPASIEDPSERIREMRRRVEDVRSEPALDFLGNLTPLLNRTPSGIAASLLSGINARAVLTTSSWPGVQEELFVAGARFERMFVFAPLPGTVLTGAMCTHAGACCIAINVDGEVIEQPELLWSAMQASLDEILALGRPADGLAAPAQDASRNGQGDPTSTGAAT